MYATFCLKIRKTSHVVVQACYLSIWKWKQEDQVFKALGQKRNTREPVLKPKASQNSGLGILLSGRESFFSTLGFITSIQISPA